MIGGATGQQEPETTTDDLDPGRNAGIGRPEEEPVDALDVLRLRAEVPGQAQEIPRVAVGGDSPPDAPCRPRGQRPGQVEPSRLEVEIRVHG